MNLFYQSSSNSQAVRVPKLRFPEFEGEWKKRQFAEFTWASGKRNKENLDLEPYAITNESGFIPQNEAHNDFGYMKNTDRKAYNIVTPNSFAYNPARINIGSIGYYEGAENVIVSSLYEVFQTTDYIDDRFLWYWFKSGEFLKWIERLQEGSVRLYFYYDKLCECQMFTPSVAEQKKIAEFLEIIDKRIEKQRQLVELLKSYKRGLSEAIFSRKLNLTLNLTCDTNIQWERHKLGTLGYFYNGLSGKTKDDFSCGNSEFITYMNVYKNTIADEQVLEYVNVSLGEKQNAVHCGDILFTQSSETLEEVGYSSVWLSAKVPYLNSFCFGFRFNTSSMIDPYFIAHYFRSSAIRSAIMREGQGATRVNLSSERLKDIVVSLPPLSMQKKIGTILNNIQMQINRNSDIIERLCAYKDGLLQSLFI